MDSETGEPQGIEEQRDSDQPTKPPKSVPAWAAPSSSVPLPPPPPIAARTEPPGNVEYVRPPTGIELFRSPLRVARVLQFLLGAFTIISGIALASSLRQVSAISSVVDDPLSVGFTELVSARDRQAAMDLVQIIAYLVVGVVFILWTRRLYRNLQPIGATPLRFSEGWAVGAWLVPFLNLVRPKQILDDIWKASEPSHESVFGPSWRFGRVSPLLHWWWAAFLANVAIGIIGSSQDVLVESTIEDSLTAANWFAIQDAAVAVLGVVAFIVVGRTTDRQVARADQIRRISTQQPEPQDHQASRGARSLAVLAGIVATTFVGVVAASLVFESQDGTNDASTEIASSNPGAGVLLDDLTIGDCVDLPSDLEPSSDSAPPLLAMRQFGCDVGHHLEVIAIVQHPAEMAAEFPGELELASFGDAACIGEVGDYVGAPWPGTGLDVQAIRPIPEGWIIGDRRFICLASSMDGEAMTTTIKGSGGIIGPSQRTPWSLENGDCFNDPPSVEKILMTVVSCDVRHNYETFAVVDHPGLPADGYPGDDAMTEFVGQVCSEEFEARVDESARDQLDFGFYGSPFPGSWSSGHRSVSCVVWDVDFPQIIGTVLID